jgi:hypothetical protein
VVDVTKRRVVIAEPELIAIARVMVGKWSEGKLGRLIIAVVAVNGGSHMLYVLRNMLAVVLGVVFAVSHWAVLLFLVEMLVTAEG